MQGMMYLLGLVLALLAGLHVTRNPDWRDRGAGEVEGDVGRAKASFVSESRVRREGLRVYAGPVVVHLVPLIVFLVLFTLIVLVFDLTYAHYIGSARSFLAFCLAACIIGLLVGLAVRGMAGEVDKDSIVERFRGRSKGLSILFVAMIIALLVTTIGLGGAASIVCIVPLVVILVIMLTVLFKVRRMGALGGKRPRPRIWGRGADTVRLALAIFAVLVLVISSVLPYITPQELDRNDLYASLVKNHVKGENPVTLEDPQEVRVVSWLLAIEYLQRAYGDSAAFLDSSDVGLFAYTDPSLVNGRFVWANAPYYETWKWFGGKKVPFFVYVVNDPANISMESGSLTHKVQVDLETHETRISWGKRLEQLTFDRYAARYEIAQIRFTIDDDENPYWVVYLAERDLWYNMLHLRKLLVVDATDMGDADEYDVDDGDIPEWLEVVYPDWYVYDWVSFWAGYRLGLGYRWFNKAHLYDPDDNSARFVVIQGRTYWQIPLVQKSSHVLGGYVWVDTRTGEATFFDREDRSLADKDTVQAQIEKYLSSGALGYQRLDIHEGYLYPLRLDDGTVREAYVFPMYAGLTVQKYAVVDAEDYTEEPYIENDLGTALDRYRARSGGGGGGVLRWQALDLVSGYAEGDEAVLSVSNSTVANLTVVVSTSQLGGGLIARGEDEMRELKLAVAAWGRGEAVSLRMVLEEGAVVDVDWEGADLVP